MILAKRPRSDIKYNWLKRQWREFEHPFPSYPHGPGFFLIFFLCNIYWVSHSDFPIFYRNLFRNLYLLHSFIINDSCNRRIIGSFYTLRWVPWTGVIGKYTDIRDLPSERILCSNNWYTWQVRQYLSIYSCKYPSNPFQQQV